MPDVTEQTASDLAFANFLSQLNPAMVEAERFRPPTLAERPGSPESLADDEAHAWIVADFWARAHETEAVRALRRERSERDAADFVAAVVAARENGTPYPTVPIRLTLAAHRAQSRAGGRAA